MGCALLKLPIPDSYSDLESLRAMAYKEVDKFIDQLAPLLEKKPTPTLREMSDHFMQTRSVLLGGIMKALTLEVTRQYGEATHADCPCCHKRVQMMRIDPKKVSTLNGAFYLDRPYFYCKSCKTGFHPLDEALELAQEVHQYDMQEKFARIAAKMPYDEASELFTQTTGLKLPGKHFGHDNLNRIGEVTKLEIVIPDKDEIERRVEQAKGDSDELPVLAVACDGAHAPTRPKAGRGKRGKGKWREVKGVRLYLIGKDDRIIHVAGWHQIAEWEQIAKDLELVAARIPKDKVRVALLGDGADWVWNVMTRSFPDARQVLDYYHMSEHISKVAKLQYGDTLDALEWKEATITRLYLDKTGHVIGGLRRMEPSSNETKEEIRKLIVYLKKNINRLGYQECRDEGIPIGSGGIESANKYISHARLKLSGAWWLEENGNAMLRIRCAIYNGTFDNVFKFYVENRNREIRPW
jgi:hypothetical protein